ncbi:MAG: hypothetical protein JWP06_1045 [Candidatus Saccharibacteria bacterium]|nr:hypothetical protein [Candidatus Saccharibacteria bacterium]
MNKYDQARQRYLPEKIRVLFIAEAPPENMERFFYYEDVRSHDALFVNLIRALYEDYRNVDILEIRRDKQKLLKQFHGDGYYLIDALPGPISLRLSPREREKLIKVQVDNIINQVRELNPEDGTVLINATVFHSLYDKVIQAGLHIRNTEAIPFPDSGQQNNFREAIENVVAHGSIFHKSHGWDPIKEFVSPILYVSGDNYQSMGTLVIIRPGLAVTAKHVITHHLEENGINAIAGNHTMPFQLLAYQLSEDEKSDASWFITNCFLSQSTDIAYLKLAPGNKQAADIMQCPDEVKIMAMDLEPPTVGSKVYGFGYPDTTVDKDDIITFNLNSHTTGGIVTEVDMRGSGRLSFPTFQLRAIVNGGMSGGPVFNEKGSLVGIMSDSFAGIEYSHAALLWPSMSTKVIFDRADYPELNGQQYPIVELAKDGHISVNGWKNITITTNGDEETIGYHNKL